MLQHARDAVTSAQAQLDVAIQQYNANQAMILGTKLEDQPAVQQAATEVRNAWLALGDRKSTRLNSSHSSPSRMPSSA